MFNNKVKKKINNKIKFVNKVHGWKKESYIGICSIELHCYEFKNLDEINYHFKNFPKKVIPCKLCWTITKDIRKFIGKK